MSGKSVLFSKSLVKPRPPQAGTTAVQPDPAKESFLSGDIFSHRVAIQQFVRSHEALFPALSDGDGVFGGMVSLANKIADAAMREFVAAGNDVGGSDIVVFRQVCSQIVERHRRNGCLDKIDVETYGRRIARLFSAIAAQEYQHDDGWERASPTSSVTMSVLNATGILYPAVALFSFFLPAGRVLNDVSAAVLAEARRALEELLPPEAPAADVRSMGQTLLRALSNIMVAVYERKAKVFCSTDDAVLAVAEHGGYEAALADVIASFSVIAREYVSIAKRRALQAGTQLSTHPEKSHNELSTPR
jgi:hypothetical protein